MEQQVIAPTDKHREQAREIVRAWLLTSNPHHLVDYKDGLIERITTALSSRDAEVKEAQSEDIRAAAKEIARFIESTTTLAVGQPMIAAIETIIHETCFRTAAPQVDDEQ